MRRLLPDLLMTNAMNHHTAEPSNFSGETPESPQFASEPLHQEMPAACEELNHKVDDLRAQAGRVLDRSGEVVRENPLPILLGALALGFALGLTAGRHHQPTARERYVDNPLQTAREALLAVLGPVAAQLREQYGHVHNAAQQAADRVQAFDPADHLDPLGKQASRLGRRLKFW